LKSLVTVSIEAPTVHEMKNARYHLNKAIAEVTSHINDGTEISRSITNADDPKEMKALFGNLQWWTISGEWNHESFTDKAQRRKGFWAHLGEEVRKGTEEIGKQAKEIYNYDPEKDG
jgi:hypothetical protein